MANELYLDKQGLQYVVEKINNNIVTKEYVNNNIFPVTVIKIDETGEPLTINDSTPNNTFFYIECLCNDYVIFVEDLSADKNVTIGIKTVTENTINLKIVSNEWKESLTISQSYYEIDIRSIDDGNYTICSFKDANYYIPLNFKDIQLQYNDLPDNSSVITFDAVSEDTGSRSYYIPQNNNKFSIRVYDNNLKYIQNFKITGTAKTYISSLKLLFHTKISVVNLSTDSPCYNNKVLKVFKSANLSVNNFNYFFYNCSSIEEVYIEELYGLTNTAFSTVFYMCTKLKRVNIKNIKPSANSIVSLANLFCSCSNLEYINFNSFKGLTSKMNITNMPTTFYGCSKLKTIDLSWVKFSTSSPVNISGICYKCTDLESITVNNLDLSMLGTVTSAFAGCSKLTHIYGNIINIKRSIPIFADCPLDRETAIMLFNGLVAGTSTLTISLSTTTKNLLTAADMAIATNKNWTIA